MKKILTFSLFFFAAISSFGQTTLTITGPDYPPSSPLNCSAIVPTGGAGTNFIDGTGNYPSNSRDTVVFCPDLTQGSKVSIAFATNIGFEFNVDPTDTIYIFDGPNTSAPLLGAYNSGTNPNGFYVQASFLNNPTGCLTVVFHSDAATEGTGWVANVACGDLPQPYYPHIEAYKNGVGANVLNPLDTGYVDVCLGDSIMLIAKPTFPYSLENTGTGYSQNAGNCTYNWDISGGGGTFSNDTIWFTPTQRVGYYVDLRITDPFPLIERITCKIRVSQQPFFGGTGSVEDTICLGTTTNLLGGVTPTDTVGVEIPGSEFAIGGIFAGLTFLPDGSGAQYTTSIAISGFDSSAVITSGADFDQLCLDIEHSYIGDLEIQLSCPNGTSVSLMNAYNSTFGSQLIPGGCGSGIGTFLGNDTNLDGGAPGTPVMTYCFSPTQATFGTICAENSAGNTIANAYGFQTMNPNGVYLPDGNFNNFAGCPVNGNWTITVRDNQGIDDGYIFQWGLYFNSSLYPESETYQNTVTTSWWSPDPSIISGMNDTSIVVQPGQVGNFGYTFNVTDNFGCHYDTTVNINVVAGPSIFPPTFTCSSTYQATGTQTFGGGVWSSPSPEVSFTTSTSDNPLITASTPGTYVINFLDNECSGTVSTQIEFLSDIAVDILDTIVCANTNFLIEPVFSSNGSLSTAYTISWNDGTSAATHLANAPGTYVITVSNSCATDKDSLTILEQPTITIDPLSCDLKYQIANTYAPNGGYWSSVDPAISFSNANSSNPLVSTTLGGVFPITFKDTVCNTTLSDSIEFPPYITLVLVDTTICIGLSADIVPLMTNITPTELNYSPTYNFSWNDGYTNTTRPVNAAGIYGATVSNECYTKTATSTVTLEPCDITVPNIIFISSTVGNNLFFITYHGLAEFNCVIVNRWGDLIYEYSDPAGHWDGKDKHGKLVTEGTYFYKINARFDGVEEGFVKQGFVVVKH